MFILRIVFIRPARLLAFLPTFQSLLCGHAAFLANFHKTNLGLEEYCFCAHVEASSIQFSCVVYSAHTVGAYCSLPLAGGAAFGQVASS